MASKDLAISLSRLHLQKDLSSSVQGRLPAELYIYLLHFLDPVTFITLSQCNRFLRQLIGPEKFHFVQRLLMLEIDYEHGGPTPIFSRGGALLLPLLDDPAWNDIRYACSACLRLRHMRFFARSAVWSLPMRKPTHDQSAAQILAEPGNAEERWLRRIAETSYGKTNKATVDLDLDRWRCNPRVRRYFGRRLFGGRFKPKHQVLDRDNGVSSAENSVLEAETCGMQRHKRVCIECCPPRQGERRMRRGLSKRHEQRASDDWDTMVIMGRPNFRVTFPGKSKYAMIDPPYLLFRCTGCLEWHKDKHAFEHSDMLQGLYEWDYQVPVPSWRKPTRWQCTQCAPGQDASEPGYEI